MKINQFNEIQIECCCNCNDHAWFTKHDPSKYDQQFNLIKTEIEKQCQLGVIKNKIPCMYQKIDRGSYENMYFDRESNQTITFPRVGSFEITYLGNIIFSKIVSGLWPNVDQVINTIKQKQRNTIQSPKEIPNTQPVSFQRNSTRVIQSKTFYQRNPFQSPDRLTMTNHQFNSKTQGSIQEQSIQFKSKQSQLRSPRVLHQQPLEKVNKIIQNNKNTLLALNVRQLYMIYHPENNDKEFRQIKSPIIKKQVITNQLAPIQKFSKNYKSLSPLKKIPNEQTKKEDNNNKAIQPRKLQPIQYKNKQVSKKIPQKIDESNNTMDQTVQQEKKTAEISKEDSKMIEGTNQDDKIQKQNQSIDKKVDVSQEEKSSVDSEEKKIREAIISEYEKNEIIKKSAKYIVYQSINSVSQLDGSNLHKKNIKIFTHSNSNDHMEFQADSVDEMLQSDSYRRQQSNDLKTSNKGPLSKSTRIVRPSQKGSRTSLPSIKETIPTPKSRQNENEKQQMFNDNQNSNTNSQPLERFDENTTKPELADEPYENRDVTETVSVVYSQQQSICSNNHNSSVTETVSVVFTDNVGDIKDDMTGYHYEKTQKEYQEEQQSDGQENEASEIYIIHRLVDNYIFNTNDKAINAIMEEQQDQ